MITIGTVRATRIQVRRWRVQTVEDVGCVAVVANRLRDIGQGVNILRQALLTEEGEFRVDQLSEVLEMVRCSEK